MDFPFLSYLLRAQVLTGHDNLTRILHPEMVNSLNSWISYYPPFLYIFPSFQETHWMYGSFIFFKPKKIQQIPNCHVPSSFLPLLTPYRFFYPSQNPWRIHPKSMRIHHLHTPTDPLVAGKKNQPAWHVITPSTSQASMLQPHRTTIFGEAPQVIQGWHTHTHTYVSRVSLGVGPVVWEGNIQKY